MSLQLLAQAVGEANCTIDGEPADCGDVAGILGAIFIPIMLIGIVGFVFWLISLIHVIKNDDVENRVMWIVLLIVLGGLAGIIYFFTVRRKYNKAHEGGASQQTTPTQPVEQQPTAEAPAPEPDASADDQQSGEGDNNV